MWPMSLLVIDHAGRSLGCRVARANELAGRIERQHLDNAIRVAMADKRTGNGDIARRTRLGVRIAVSDDGRAIGQGGRAVRRAKLTLSVDAGGHSWLKCGNDIRIHLCARAHTARENDARSYCEVPDTHKFSPV
jgi:hypothetical protein